MTRIHELKCWPDFFTAIDQGDKTFELRKNDRGFQAGDVLCLNEWDPNWEYSPAEPRRRDNYTGREMHVRVKYVLSGSRFGLLDGWVAMAIEVVE